jgi:hypothetical protein
MNVTFTQSDLHVKNLEDNLSNAMKSNNDMLYEVCVIFFNFVLKKHVLLLKILEIL